MNVLLCSIGSVIIVAAMSAATIVVPSEWYTGNPRMSQATTIVGGVNIRDRGSNRIGGEVGIAIDVVSEITATSSLGSQIDVEFRHQLSDARCLDFEDFDRLALPWEDLRPIVTDTYSVAVANFVTLYQSVEFRDEIGSFSPVYCDDVTLEGFYPTPTFQPTATSDPSRTPVPTLPAVCLLPHLGVDR